MVAAAVEAWFAGMVAERCWQACAMGHVVIYVYKDGGGSPFMPFGSAKRAVSCRDMARFDTQIGPSRIARRADSVSCWASDGCLYGFSRWLIYVFSLHFFAPGICAGAAIMLPPLLDVARYIFKKGGEVICLSAAQNSS